MIRIIRDRTTAAIPAGFRPPGNVKKELTLLVARQDHLKRLQADPATGHGYNTKWWNDAKPQLIIESARKCAYCEAKTTAVTYGDVEHFRPKAEWWWLTCCWDNYLFSCQICNQLFKSENFPKRGKTSPAPVMLRALRSHGLLKGKHLVIDSSVMEANASLRGLQHRNSEQEYWDYVKGLAREAGVNPEDIKAMRRFDRQRPGRKTSNRDWVNPHDPEAKVGRTKQGATDMIYKPEHLSDLESGAIIDVQVRPGDAADNDGSMAQRVLAAVGTLSEVAPDANPEKLGATVVADEGYFALGQIAELQRRGLRTVIADPQAARRRTDLPMEELRTLRRARAATRSQSGKALLRKRGEHLERGFAHVLDHGGLRRATLRGCENLTKRYLIAALSANLSLLLRTLCGTGTAKQWLAKPWQAMVRQLDAFRTFLQSLLASLSPVSRSTIPMLEPQLQLVN
jgi:transposase